MKKILLCITLLFSFFLSPVKGASYDNYPYIKTYSEMDLSALGMAQNQTVSATWYFDPAENGLLSYYSPQHLIYNNADYVLLGNIIIDIGTTSNPVTFVTDFSFNSKDFVAVVTYMNVTFQVDNFTVFEVGNGFKWFGESTDNENPSTNVDLTTIHNYMLVICLLLFMNFLRGR